METLDIIKQLCKEKKISLAQLENDLEYGNGSIAKSKGNMSAERMFQIAKYLKVPMEYLMTGKTVSEVDDEVAIVRQQQSILLEISKVSERLSDLYKTIDKCKDELLRLKGEYNKLEIQKRKINNQESFELGQDPSQQAIQGDLFNLFDVKIEDELPFN